MAGLLNPEDVLVLLKLAVMRSCTWDLETLSFETGHTCAELSESISRLQGSGFLDLDNSVFISRLKDFLINDLHELFPASPGKLTRGTLTGAKPSTFLDSQLPYTSIWVWENADGPDQGFEITPLSPQCCFAALNDGKLKQLLAVTETLRVVGEKARPWGKDRLNSLLPEL